MVSRLRDKTVAAAGTTPIPPSPYRGQQPVHPREAFPGLVADMKGGFSLKGDSLWGNLMNVTANTHLQIDGTLRAILQAQRDANTIADANSLQIAAAAESTAVIAGAALMALRVLAGNADISREEVLEAGSGLQDDADNEPDVPEDAEGNAQGPGDDGK